MVRYMLYSHSEKPGVPVRRTGEQLHVCWVLIFVQAAGGECLACGTAAWRMAALISICCWPTQPCHQLAWQLCGSLQRVRWKLPMVVAGLPFHGDLGLARADMPQILHVHTSLSPLLPWSCRDCGSDYRPLPQPQIQGCHHQVRRCAAHAEADLCSLIADWSVGVLGRAAARAQLSLPLPLPCRCCRQAVRHLLGVSSKRRNLGACVPPAAPPCPAAT